MKQLKGSTLELRDYKCVTMFYTVMQYLLNFSDEENKKKYLD